jgi:hypothetical protein
MFVQHDIRCLRCREFFFVSCLLLLPRSIANIFGNWLNRMDSRHKTIIRVRAIAVAWSVSLCRNDKAFL